MAAQRDPHDIVPDTFWDEHDSLRDARQARSTTKDDDRPRCPNPDCRSVSIVAKPGSGIQKADPHRIDADYHCANCQNHFDDPINSDIGGSD